MTGPDVKAAPFTVGSVVPPGVLLCDSAEIELAKRMDRTIKSTIDGQSRLFIVKMFARVTSFNAPRANRTIAFRLWLSIARQWDPREDSENLKNLRRIIGLLAVSRPS
jgi:hypothetical protein